MSENTQASDRLGTESIPSLITRLSIPSAIGILVLSLNGLIDSMYVGNYVGSEGIAALTVVLPFTFLLANLGMATGVGAGSIISRALGEGHRQKAEITFHNALLLVGVFMAIGLGLAFLFTDQVLAIFGAEGDILPPAKTYLKIWLYGIPALGFGMMTNNIFRAEGKPNISMIVMLVPAITNLILDPIFIIYLDMGIAGAGWATTIAHVLCGAFALGVFLLGKSELPLPTRIPSPDFKVIRDILSLGGVSFARQSVISLLAIVINNSLYTYGGSIAVSAYGIIWRVMFFVFFPVIGIVQAFLPIVGFNYGAQKIDRVRETIFKSILSGTIISCLILVFIFSLTPQLVGLFTNEQDLIDLTVPAIRTAFLATPILAIQLFGSAYYQAIGKAFPALMLTLTKHGFCLIPLLFIFPVYMGLEGIWWSFPVADTLASMINFYFLYTAYKKLSH